MHNVKDQKIWNKSIDLSIKVYDVTAKFPANDCYGLISQIRSCAVSIPSSISEGAGINSNKEFLQFLGIANESSYELQTQLLISERIDFIDNKICNELL